MIRRAGILVLLTAAFAAAANDPVAAILDQARGTRVEIFADVVFHLLETNRIAEKDRVPLLEEVFLRANDARQSMPLRPAVPTALGPAPGPVQIVANGQTATLHLGAMAVAGSKIPVPAQIHLDALSIKCRVVRALLAIDGKRARDRFADIPTPDAGKPACTALVIPDPSIYFDTLAAVVTQAKFTNSEREKSVPFWMVESAIRGAHTSLDVIAAARNFSLLASNGKEGLALSSAFASALSIDDSNRNFTAAMTNSNLVDAMLMANDRFVKKGASPQTVMTALRGYLVRHLSASWCADNGDSPYDASLKTFDLAAGFQTTVPPITTEEATPAKVDGVADIPKTPDQSEYLALWRSVNAVADDPSASADDVLAKIQAWKGADGQDPLDVFHKKLGLYAGMTGFFMHRVSITPLSAPESLPATTLEARDQTALVALIAFLSDPVFLDASPSDWLTEVRALENRQVVLTQVQFGKNEFKTVAIKGVPPEFTTAMISSSLSALSVYGHVEALEQKPVSRPAK